jgi:hypothetical protein
LPTRERQILEDSASDARLIPSDRLPEYERRATQSLGWNIIRSHRVTNDTKLSVTKDLMIDMACLKSTREDAKD